MPDGSSSAAPVTRPGPSNRSTMFWGFLAFNFLRSGRLASVMKFCEVRDKLEDQALARKHRLFSPAIKEIYARKFCAGEFSQETLRWCNNPARLGWFHCLNESC